MDAVLEVTRRHERRDKLVALRGNRGLAVLDDPVLHLRVGPDGVARWRKWLSVMS